MSRARALEARLGYRFREPRLLEVALTHRSHSHERGRAGESDYERLEFLGDALLGFLVAHWLFDDDPRAAEGVLSRRRQSVVRTATLARAARELSLGAAVRLGKGEERTGGREKESLLADTFEAVLAAVYLDGGIRSARAFVKRHLGAILRDMRDRRESLADYKTQLQERIQAELRLTPRYRIVSTAGPAHAREFESEVLLGRRVLAAGRGSSRKQAEQEAARRALQELSSTGGDPG